MANLIFNLRKLIGFTLVTVFVFAGIVKVFTVSQSGLDKTAPEMLVHFSHYYNLLSKNQHVKHMLTLLRQSGVGVDSMRFVGTIGVGEILSSILILLDVTPLVFLADFFLLANMAGVIYTHQVRGTLYGPPLALFAITATHLLIFIIELLFVSKKPQTNTLTKKTQ